MPTSALEVVDGEVRELEDTLAGVAPDGEPGWDEGGAQDDPAPAYHEDFDELDEEEPEDDELEEGEFDQDELQDGDLADDEFEDDELYEDDPPADPDATVEVDALDLPDDREARS